jgi:hypothetical protein
MAKAYLLASRIQKLKIRSRSPVDRTSGEISPENMNSLLTKLRFHKVTKDEAREFLLIFTNEIKAANYGDKREYKKVVIGLTEILKMYLTDVIDLNGKNFDVLNELDTLKTSSKVT